MEPIDIYQLQADYYTRLPLIIPNIKACIHLENSDDIPFWDSQLQKTASGTYEYITHSKSKSGEETSGCEQCLKFKPYLNKKFFICIDSDLRQFLSNYDIDVTQHIAQTHTYSWENHCCESNNLCKRIATFEVNFDLCKFLTSLSLVLYQPLIYLIYYKQEDNTQWNITKFNKCIPYQVKRSDLENNGSIIIKKIKDNFEASLSRLCPDNIKIKQVEERCNAKGLTQKTAYLHIQGHALYNLVNYIGTLLYRGTNIQFQKVLNDFSTLEDYPEIKKVRSDLAVILDSPL